MLGSLGTDSDSYISSDLLATVVNKIPKHEIGFILMSMLCKIGSRGSSVSIVSGYGLDDRAIVVRSPAKGFSCSLCVQTGSGAHPASFPVGTGGPFPGVKRGMGVTLTTYHILCVGRD
jgi:hypothetical protein